MEARAVIGQLRSSPSSARSMPFVCALTVGASLNLRAEPPANHPLEARLVRAGWSGEALATASESPAVPDPSRRLQLVSVVRLESVDLLPFDQHGRPLPRAFAQLNHLFRSSRDTEVPIDPRLIQLLIEISQAFEGRQLVLISGYRDPTRRSRKSYHVRGMAADIAIRGVRSRDVHREALRLGAPGLGLYPHFIHVDVRDVPYRWARWPRARR